MNYVTFKIIESRNGEFILYLNNHSTKIVSEECRSKNLDKVVKKLKGKMNYRKHFMNALSNYAPVLDEEFAQKLEEADKGLRFPESPSDILEYLGNIDLLGMTEREKQTVRTWVKGQIDQKGPQYVWKYKLKSKLELRYIIHDLGM